MTTDHVDLLVARSRYEELGYSTPCLVWQGGTDSDGYPSVCIAGRWPKPARLMHAAFVGPIPEGYVLDHLCHTSHPTCSGPCRHRRCIEPTHTEAVTRAENGRRQHARADARPERERTTCPYGHQRDRRPGGNLACRPCDAARARARRATRRTA